MSINPFYDQIISFLVEKPDLTQIDTGQAVPEQWPFILEKINPTKTTKLHVQITDGNISMTCVIAAHDLQKKVRQFELGQIIFLHDSRLVINTVTKEKEILAGNVLSLKEVDEIHKKQPKAIETIKKASEGSEINSAVNFKGKGYKWKTLGERLRAQGRLT